MYFLLFATFGAFFKPPGSMHFQTFPVKRIVPQFIDDLHGFLDRDAWMGNPFDHLTVVVLIITVVLTVLFTDIVPILWRYRQVDNKEKNNKEKQVFLCFS